MYGSHFSGILLKMWFTFLSDSRILLRCISIFDSEVSSINAIEELMASEAAFSMQT